MRSIRNLVLGAAVLAATAGFGATKANAAVRVFVGGPVAYVPACPGPGYAWVAGYYASGYWVPGRWNFVGVRGPVVVDRFHQDRFYDQRFDRGWDRAHDRFRR
jgi:hypothetical protein